MNIDLTFTLPYYSESLTETEGITLSISIGDRIEDYVATRIICRNRDHPAYYRFIDVLLQTDGWTYDTLLEMIARLFDVNKKCIKIFVGADELKNRELAPHQDIDFANDPVFHVFVY
jgi:hypothetical protein